MLDREERSYKINHCTGTDTMSSPDNSHSFDLMLLVLSGDIPDGFDVVMAHMAFKGVPV